MGDEAFEPEAILRALNAHGVEYVVVGGFAVAAHGVIRATADLDLVVDRGWRNATRLAAALDELGARDASAGNASPVPEVLVRRADHRFSTKHGDLHLLSDVAGVPDYRDLLPAHELTLGEHTVPVSTLADLRRMKRAARRPKDEIDLAELDELHGPEVD